MFGLWNSIIITRMRKIHSVIYHQLSNCQYGSVTCEKEVSNNSVATLQFTSGDTESVMCDVIKIRLNPSLF